ncbi:MAG: hypothetical protein ACJ8KF_12145, partial [Chthoniobacterales bacterium]
RRSSSHLLRPGNGSVATFHCVSYVANPLVLETKSDRHNKAVCYSFMYLLAESVMRISGGAKREDTYRYLRL